jgi:glutaredoxin
MIIEIYTRNECPLCDQAKTLLKQNNIEFLERKIGVHISRDLVIGMFPGISMLPICVKDGTLIGGLEQLQNWVDERDNVKRW